MKDLIQFCQTVHQVELVEALIKEGSGRKAAKALGVSERNFYHRLARIKKHAALKGYSPEHDMDKIVPDGFKVKGVSTYYDKEGQKAGQWVKSSLDDERREELLRQFAESLAEEVEGLGPITPAPKHSNDELMCVYPLGDPHFGMYAWWRDAGADFDLATAERLTKAAVDRLVSVAPPASIGLLLNLGDMFHADNQSNQTMSGHQLDVDGRWAKVQQVGLMCMVHCIQRMLEKHKSVIFRINKGNHDRHTSQALAIMLSCWFRNEPRVTIDLSPANVWYYVFGKNFIGSTHGDEIKGKDMMGVMAADRPAEWGATCHRVFYVGHVHHDDKKEYAGGIVEYMRTLAARDAWHQGMGYRAGRDMRLIVHHKEHGEIERHRCDIGMLQ